MLRVNHASLHKMKVHASRAYPEECCGMLIGRDDDQGRMVCDVVRMKNEGHENRERRFLITPEQYRRAEELARKGGLEVVGFYHSHPDHPAEPSQHDLEHAMPWWSYIIVSVENRLPASARAWVLQDDRRGYEEQNMQVLDGEFEHRCK